MHIKNIPQSFYERIIVLFIILTNKVLIGTYGLGSSNPSQIGVYNSSLIMTNSFSAHSYTIGKILAISNLNYIVTSSDSDSVKVWSSLTWSLVQTHPNIYICSMDYIGNGIVALGSREWYIYTWNISSNVILSASPKLPTTPTSLKSLQTDNLLAAGMHSGWIYIYNYTNGATFASMSHCSLVIYSLELINVALLASGCADGSIKLWNWQVVFNFTGHTASVNILKLVSTTLLASGSSDNTIKLWDITNGALLNTLIGHNHQIWTLDMIQSCVLVSGSLDMTMIKWDLMSGGVILSSVNTSMKIQALVVLPLANSKLK